FGTYIRRTLQVGGWAVRPKKNSHERLSASKASIRQTRCVSKMGICRSHRGRVPHFRLQPALGFATDGGAAAVVPENPIRLDSRDAGESEHHSTRCLPSSFCLERLSPTCSGRGAGLKSRTFFSGISSILRWGVHRTVYGSVGVTACYWY